jgi:hypothetical protein
MWQMNELSLSFYKVSMRRHNDDPSTSRLDLLSVILATQLYPCTLSGARGGLYV